MRQSVCAASTACRIFGGPPAVVVLAGGVVVGGAVVAGMVGGGVVVSIGLGAAVIVGFGAGVEVVGCDEVDPVEPVLQATNKGKAIKITTIDSHHSLFIFILLYYTISLSKVKVEPSNSLYSRGEGF